MIFFTDFDNVWWTVCDSVWSCQLGGDEMLHWLWVILLEPSDCIHQIPLPPPSILILGLGGGS